MRNIKRLETNEKFRENPEILSSMEGAMMEIEILAKHAKVKGHYPVILAHFLYRTRPHMNFNNEYQRGPVHVGRVAMTFRAYSWTQEQIDNYLAHKDEILDYCQNFSRLTKQSLRTSSQYLSEFFKIIQTPGVIDDQFIHK